MIGRTAQFWGRGVGQRVRSWADMVAGARRRMFEGAGAALVLTSLLVTLALLTYDPRDPSLDTAIDGPARNFLGHDGAYVADLLVQSIGLAAYLIPVVLLGWAFRMLLQRPLRRVPRRLGLLALALVLAAAACSVLQVGSDAAAGGHRRRDRLGILRALANSGFGALALPLAMIEAALVALLLLTVMGLSPGDWRDIGRGAGRGAARLAFASGRGTAAAAGFGYRRWQRILRRTGARPSLPGRGRPRRRRRPYKSRGDADARAARAARPHARLPSPAPPAEEPSDGVEAGAAGDPAGAAERSGKARRAGAAAWPARLVPDDEPLLPELDLLVKAAGRQDRDHRRGGAGEECPHARSGARGLRRARRRSCRCARARS